MKAGVGQSNDRDAFACGREAAANAISNGAIDEPTFVLAFCGGRLDHHNFYEGMRSVIGNATPIVGGSAIGVITNDHLSYDGYSAGIAILESGGLECDVESVGDLDSDERLAGQLLAGKFSASISAKLLFMFYDSVKIPPTESGPPIMNASPALMEGFESAFASSIPIVGAGLVGDYEFSPPSQFLGSRVGNQSVVGARLGGDFHVDFRVTHGCVPMDGIYHTISRIEGPIIYEIDGRPAVDIIDEHYGNKNWRSQTPLKRLAVGVNLGERFGPFREKEYVNRLITGPLPDDRGIVIFEPDLANGTEIQFMLRDSEKMIESARTNSIELVESLKLSGREPVLGLYIDCAGRTATFSDTLTEEASEVSRTLSQNNIPMLGFYSGVEIAPMAGKSRGLDWTGVLLIISRG